MSNRTQRSAVPKAGLCAAAAVLWLGAGAAGAAPIVTVGQNFTGSNIGQSGFFPPDSMGAIGPDHFVELINGRYAVYDRDTGLTVQASSLNAFWNNAGGGYAGSFAFDPRIVYDKHSGRWFAAAVDNHSGNNNFLVAVSNTSDPTQGWQGFRIDSDTSDTRWADFPMLGVNSEGVYLSANMFAQSGVSTSATTTMLVIPKADLLAPTPTAANATLFENPTPNGTGFSVQPALDLDNGSQPLPLLSAYNGSNLKISSFTGPITGPTLDTAGGFVSVPLLGSPPDADQPGTSTDIETSDRRFSGNVILRDGDLWGVQTVRDGDGNAALRWVRIDDPLGAASILDSGLIRSAAFAGLTGFDFYFGSIAVNEYGDVVIGFSASGPSAPDGYVSAYAIVGETIGNQTLFGDPLLLKQGVATYVRFDGSGRNRWGDYSAVTIDPTDPRRFWTIQEWASGNNLWSTQITEIVVASPQVPEPATLALLAAGLGGMAVLMRRPQARTAQAPIRDAIR